MGTRRRTRVSLREPARGRGAGVDSLALDSFGLDSLALDSSLGFCTTSWNSGFLSPSEGAGAGGSFLSTCWSLGSEVSLDSAAGADSVPLDAEPWRGVSSVRNGNGCKVEQKSAHTSSSARLDNEQVLANSDGIFLAREKFHDSPSLGSIDLHVNLRKESSKFTEVRCVEGSATMHGRTLSVSMVATSSSASTKSPSCFTHDLRVPSLMDSAIWGTLTVSAVYGWYKLGFPCKLPDGS